MGDAEATSRRMLAAAAARPSISGGSSVTTSSYHQTRPKRHHPPSGRACDPRAPPLYGRDPHAGAPPAAAPRARRGGLYPIGADTPSHVIAAPPGPASVLLFVSGLLLGGGNDGALPVFDPGIGTLTRPSTASPLRLAGMKRQWSRTVATAESSSGAKPEDRRTRTSAGRPSGVTRIPSRTTPSLPSRRATSGYGGSGFVP